MDRTTARLSPRTKSILTQVGSFALAGLLLFFALRGVAFDELGDILQSARYGWVLPLVLVAFLSHLIRAWRWRLFIETLPAPPDNNRLRMRHVFGALLIGYMVNYAAPRLGEVARTSVMSRLSGRTFSGILGTVVAERILDMITLLLALGSVAWIFRDRVAELLDRLLAIDVAGYLPLIGAGATVLLVIAVVVYLLIRRSNSSSGRNRLIEWLSAFAGGVRSVAKSPRPTAILVTTVAMWLCYAMMAYLPLQILGLAGTNGLDLVDAWSIMNIGALGVVVPSPGGIGSYHYITTQALTQLYGVETTTAAAYSIVTHGIQLIAYVAAGFAAMVGLGMSLGSLLNRPD